MARRKTTTRRRKTAARKSTTRRRAPARRRKTTRRKSTTRRRKSPAKRRRTTRRKSTPPTQVACKEERRPEEGSPPLAEESLLLAEERLREEEKLLAEESLLHAEERLPEEESLLRRRKTTRRRKSTGKRRRTARRRSVSRRRTARRRMKMPGLGGFTKYVKKHLDTSAIAMVLGGLALPTLAVTAYQKLNLGKYIESIPFVGPTLRSNPFGQAALGVVTSAALTYGLASAGVMKESTALGMNMIALGVFAATAIASQFSAVSQYLPYNVSIDGYHSMAGYRGGYLGYLGNVETAEALPAPVEDQLFGVGSAPSFNVF